jgi:tRNA 2-thiouridine synthesizing protein A
MQSIHEQLVTFKVNGARRGPRAAPALARLLRTWARAEGAERTGVSEAGGLRAEESWAIRTGANKDAMTQIKDIVVDARGHRCPIPTLRLQRALNRSAPGQRVKLLADDPLARIDVPHFLAAKGYALIESATDGEVLSFLAARPT